MVGDDGDLRSISLGNLTHQARDRPELLPEHVVHHEHVATAQQLEFGAEIEALASADPPVHTLHRRAVFPELVAKKMAELAPEITRLANECVRSYVAAGGGDFMDTVANPVPINVISWLIGFRDGDTDLLLQSAADSTMMVGGAMTLEDLTALIERTAEVSAWINRQITAGGAPEDVLLGTIAKAVAEQAITLDQGVVILLTLLSAGGESTTSLIGNAARTGRATRATGPATSPIRTPGELR